MTDDTEHQPSIRELGVNLNEVEAPVPLPASSYPAVIKDCKVKANKAGDGEYVALTLYVSPDDYPADYTDGNPDGETLSYNRVKFSIEDKRALHRLKKLLTEIGVLDPNVNFSRFDPSELIGRNVTVTVKHGEWEGEKRAEVDKISAA